MIPTQGNHFLIWEQNMEFRRGRGNGWFLVGVCADDEDDNEAFTLKIACELIGETIQRDGVQVIHQNEEESDIGFFRGLSPFPNHNYIYIFTSHNINCSTRLIEVQHVEDMLAIYQHNKHMSVDIMPTRGRHVSKQHVDSTPAVPLPTSFYVGSPTCWPTCQQHVGMTNTCQSFWPPFWHANIQLCQQRYTPWYLLEVVQWVGVTFHEEEEQEREGMEASCPQSRCMAEQTKSSIENRSIFRTFQAERVTSCLCRLYLNSTIRYWTQQQQFTGVAASISYPEK